MKILFIGPYPPPHGGVSVHVLRARRELESAGVRCQVINLDRTAPPSDAYKTVRNAWGLMWVLFRFAREGWTLHLHTNGHNWKSWVVALLCGLPGKFAPGSLLTLHSGMCPAYLRDAPWLRRVVARIACSLYRRIVCASPEICEAIRSLGVSQQAVDVLPAFLPASPEKLPPAVHQWLCPRRPILSATLFFRPEYGFEVLVEAVRQLRKKHRDIGCLVMGGGEDRSQALRLVERAGLEGAILLAGDLEHGACLAVIARSDVFVRPTLHDGDANSVREAMSFGVSVVASNVGLRPPGALLFTAGQASELAAQVEVALGHRTPSHAPPAQTQSLESLLSMYGRVAARCRS